MPTSYLKIRPAWRESGPRKDGILELNFDKVCKSIGMAVLVIFFVVSIITVTPRTIAAHDSTKNSKCK